MTKILIGTPCYNGWVTTDYMVSMLGLQNELNRHGIGMSIEMPGSVSLIPIARNYIVSKLLQNKDLTHLLFVDADIGFEPSLVPRYLAANKDIVAGIYPLKHLDLPAVQRVPAGESIAATLHYAVSVCEGEQPTSDGFVRADYAATGFMLIQRHVLEQMAARYHDLKYQRSVALQSSEAPTGSDHLYALFDTSIDRDKSQYLPEDYTFCKRWRAMGGEIWVDVFSKFTHVGSFAYQGDFSVFVKRS